jgi:hypothetical protein
MFTTVITMVPEVTRSQTAEWNTAGRRLLSRPPNTYNQKSEENEATNFRVEAESNTSTVALPVVGGDEKGSLESETVRYGRESHGTRTRK